jgi:putative redox protein
MTYRISWQKEDLLFEGASPEGLKIRMDSSPEFGGKGRGPRPAELLLMALGGCTGMDVISILKKKRAQVEGLEIEVRGERSTEHPKVFTKIELVYALSGKDLKVEDIERAVELSMEKYCVVANTLKKTCPVEYSWRIRDTRAST